MKQPQPQLHRVVARLVVHELVHARAVSGGERVPGVWVAGVLEAVSDA